MHTLDFAFPSQSLPLKLWGVYVWLSMVSLVFMAVTGLYFWLGTSRRRVRWALATSAVSAAGLVVLFVVMR